MKKVSRRCEALGYFFLPESSHPRALFIKPIRPNMPIAHYA